MDKIKLKCVDARVDLHHNNDVNKIMSCEFFIAFNLVFLDFREQRKSHITHTHIYLLTHCSIYECIVHIHTHTHIHIKCSDHIGVVNVKFLFAWQRFLLGWWISILEWSGNKHWLLQLLILGQMNWLALEVYSITLRDYACKMQAVNGLLYGCKSHYIGPCFTLCTRKSLLVWRLTWIELNWNTQGS